MRVLLIFPPQCRPLHPYLSLPIVKAELQRRGHLCKVVDLNLRFYKHVFTPSVLTGITQKLHERREMLDGSTLLGCKNTIELYRIGTALIRSRYLIQNVTEAVKVFQSEDFYDYGRLLWAKKVLEEALDLYGSAFGSTDIGLSHFRMRYGTASPIEIRRATEDANENPFINLLPAWADEEVEDFRADAIGISFAFDEQLIPGFTVASHLRSRWNLPMFAGGSMVTRLRGNLPSEVHIGNLFDKFFAYESEGEFGALLDSMEGHAPKPQADSFQVCPDFDDLPLKDYFLPTLILPYLGSRGCSFGKCFYCSHYQTFEKYAYGNPFAAAEHLKALSEKHDCRHFHFVDEAMEPGFGVKFVQALDACGLRASWMVFARMQKGWTSDIIKTVASGGCRRLIFGLDASTERIQGLMNKHTDLEHAENVLQWCSHERIAAQINFIVGYPGEEEHEARDVVRFVERNRDSLLTVGVSVAVSNFAMVSEAAWNNMQAKVMVDPAKPFAIYHAYIPTSGISMGRAAVLGQEIQSEADRLLRSSWRFPLLREMAFLYNDRYAGREPLRSNQAPAATPATLWFSHDLHAIGRRIVAARAALHTAPEEYQSVWWRLTNETMLSSQADSASHGYQMRGHFTENTFELSIVDAFSIRSSGDGDISEASANGNLAEFQSSESVF